eukprot:TRINITY_DN3334_c3_g1_i1.p1 TRINITY_DN3334_c3_g1~~TRINITY_DN3334_c3_g1_i1.p1  ORF type:complete len:357 (+),score=79.00 TRINITY_DN3334_c3_g1_i1:54-1073(+)
MTRWGIISTGKIANDFSLAIKKAGGVLEAVASRDVGNAKAFGEKLGFKKAYGSYKEVYGDGEVDVVYIATPHSHHYECVMEALEAGKAVVCEKPMCPTLWQTERCIAKAKEKGVFLMEGLWTRFFPVTKMVREVVASELGEIRYVFSSFGFDAGEGRTGRLFEPGLAGGSLLDIGVYPLSWVVMLLGEPESIHANGIITSTGVDEFMTATLRYKNGAVAQVQSSLTCPLTNESHVSAKNGLIQVRAPSHCPDTLEIKRHGVSTTIETRPLDPPHIGLAPGYNFVGSQGFVYEVEAVQKALKEKKTCCDEMPLEDSLIVARICDEIRKQLNLTYPFDAEQ